MGHMNVVLWYGFHLTIVRNPNTNPSFSGAQRQKLKPAPSPGASLLVDMPCWGVGLGQEQSQVPVCWNLLYAHHLVYL